MLSSVALATAFEREILADRPTEGQVRWGRLIFWCPVLGICLILLVAGTAWHLLTVALVVLCLVSIAARASAGAQKYLVGLWCLTAIVALVWHDQTSALDAPLAAEEVELHNWVQNDTSKDALFIVPPGMESFRHYCLRSVYVDFKFFPTAVPAMLPEWRRRLEQVAAPDSVALASKGIPAVAEWDRTYANRNTPQRIAELLTETDADYLVWDRQGLDRPPYVPVDRHDDPRVGVCFENDRFCVYRRKKVDL